MDSFSVFFRDKISEDEIRTAIRATGASASSRSPGEIVVSRETAHLWVDLYSPADLPSRQDWAIPKHDVGCVLYVAVSRDDASSALAVDVAHQLSSQLEGIISWDGNEYWRNLYDKAYQGDSKS